MCRGITQFWAMRFCHCFMIRHSSLDIPSLIHSCDSRADHKCDLRLNISQTKLSLERGSVEQLFGGIAKSHTRALAGTESSSTLQAMKVIHSLNRLVSQEASGHSTIRVARIARTPWHIRRRDSLPLREAIPLWFAVSSPLIGVILGFLGAWFVTWLTS
jgi:hypothetical protein